MIGIPMTGLLLSDDLIDASRITATARALGLDVRQLKSTDALLAAAEANVPGAVLVDLHNPGLDVASLVEAMRKVSPRPSVIGFGSHVDAARLKSARQAGCDRVLPRSQFFEELEANLREWLR